MKIPNLVFWATVPHKVHLLESADFFTGLATFALDYALYGGAHNLSVTQVHRAVCSSVVNDMSQGAIGHGHRVIKVRVPTPAALSLIIRPIL